MGSRADTSRQHTCFSILFPPITSFTRKRPALVHSRGCSWALASAQVFGGVCTDQNYERNFWKGLPLPRQWCCRSDCQPNASISANCTFTHVAVDYSWAWVPLMKVNLP